MVQTFVFVYGTLKRDRPNHKLLCDTTKGSARFVGEATLADPYPLVMASEYKIPFLLDAKNHHGSFRVKGEVYEVDDDMLHHLDLLENHPDGYIRRVTQLHFDDPHVPKEAQAYFFHSFRANVLPPHPTGLPMYESFTLEHVEAYTPRHLRPPNNGFWPVIYAALR